jgi:hypothetical protein
VTTTITVEDVTSPGDSIYLDYLIDNPLNNTLYTDYVIGSYWHEIHPNYSIRYQVIDAVDNGNDILDSCDILTMQTIDLPIDTSEFHILDVATDIITEEIKDCQGMCGDANYEGKFNVAAVGWIINYIFAGGDPPQPVLACGDVNGDCKVNIGDAVWLLNYVFMFGLDPGDCCPGGELWIDGDCCPFVPPK